MGSAAAGRLTSSYFGVSATVLGAAGGVESHTLTTAQLPAHSHGVTDTGHAHVQQFPSGGGGGQASAGGSSNGSPTSGNISTATAVTGITINNAGGGTGHNNVQPTMLTTIYIKL